uniref:Transmembrane protein n=1 Tax=Heterorhabditis bacteriophora TaxID=37862 RepID=A0A1I7X2K4_HETBA
MEMRMNTRSNIKKILICLIFLNIFFTASAHKYVHMDNCATFWRTFEMAPGLGALNTQSRPSSRSTPASVEGVGVFFLILSSLWTMLALYELVAFITLLYIKNYFMVFHRFISYIYVHLYNHFFHLVYIHVKQDPLTLYG